MVRQPIYWGRQFTDQFVREKGQTAFLDIRGPKGVFFEEKFSNLLLSMLKMMQSLFFNA
jgi:hypothetical protein